MRSVSVRSHGGRNGQRSGTRCVIAPSGAEERKDENNSSSSDRRTGQAIVPLTHIVEAGDGMRVFCEAVGCGHWQDLDPVSLVERLGDSVTVADIKSRMRCSKCGSRDVAIQRVAQTPYS